MQPCFARYFRCLHVKARLRFDSINHISVHQAMKFHSANSRHMGAAVGLQRVFFRPEDSVLNPGMPGEEQVESLVL